MFLSVAAVSLKPIVHQPNVYRLVENRVRDSNSNSNILFAHRSNHNTRKVTQLKSRNRLDTREDTVLSG